jgi:hypothetical protein
MTPHDDLETRLAGWLSDAAQVRAPLRVLEGAVRRTMSTNQVPAIPGAGPLVGPFPSPFARAAAIVAAIAAVAIVAMVGLGLATGPTPQLPAVGAAAGVRWQTEVVSLEAADFVIEADGKRFVGTPGAMSIHSDPGTLTYWTLEVEWREHAREMRLNIYFAADDRDWWASQIRTYDGRDPGDWIEYHGVFFKRPLGQTFAGDIDLTSSTPFPGRLVFRELRLTVHPQPSFVAPAGGGINLTTDPFEIGGQLHCSGILQRTPQEAEQILLGLGYRLSWRAMSTSYAERRLSPPDGVITGSAYGSSGELILFVWPTDDPAKDPPATFPADCPPLSPTPGP